MAELKERAMALAKSMSDTDFKAFVILRFELLERVGGRSELFDDSPFQEENMPFETLEEFKNFNTRLEDKTFRRSVIRELSLVSGDDLGTLTRAILSRVISNKLGSQISYAGSRGSKVSFVDTKIKAVVFKAIRLSGQEKFKETTDERIKPIIQKWFILAAQRTGGPKSINRKKKMVASDQIEDEDSESDVQPPNPFEIRATNASQDSSPASSRRSPPASPRRTPPASFRRSPAASPRRPPQTSPQRSPQTSPRRSPQTSPRRSPQTSPRRSPQTSPRRSPQTSPRRSPQSSPRRSPQSSPQRSPPSSS